MAPIRKHGGHRYNISISANIAAGTQTFEGINFDGFAQGTLDAAQEFLLEANIVTSAVLTGQATNFASIALQQYSVAGVLKNDIRVAFSAAGVVTVAFAPMNYNVAAGAVVPGAGTGVLTLQTGIVLPWPIVTGDSIVLAKIVTGTGLATPEIWATFLVGVKS
jgi:hypothetical protein